MPRARVTDEDVGRTLRQFLEQTARTVQTSTGGSTSGVGATPATPAVNPMTEANQMIRGGVVGTPTAIAAPTVAGHVLTANVALEPAWAAPSASGGGIGDSWYEPATNGNPSAPELYFDATGDVVMLEAS